MTSKRRIAIAVAGLFLGAQIGMAALSELQETAGAAGPEQETVAEQGTGPELAASEAPSETEAASQEAQPEQTAEIPQRDYFAEALAEARYVELVLPSAAYDHPPMLPATLAYLERLETRHLAAGPVEDVIPASYEPEPLLPATIAYLEQKEAAARFAASDGTIVAEARPAQ